MKKPTNLNSVVVTIEVTRILLAVLLLIWHEFSSILQIPSILETLHSYRKDAAHGSYVSFFSASAAMICTFHWNCSIDYNRSLVLGSTSTTARNDYETLIRESQQSRTQGVQIQFSAYSSIGV